MVYMIEGSAPDRVDHQICGVLQCPSHYALALGRHPDCFHLTLPGILKGLEEWDSSSTAASGI